MPLAVDYGSEMKDIGVRYTRAVWRVPLPIARMQCGSTQVTLQNGARTIR